MDCCRIVFLAIAYFSRGSGDDMCECGGGVLAVFYLVFLERAFAGLESTDREVAREVEGRQRERGASSSVVWVFTPVVARRKTCNGFS
jgi:hypothetical protein